MLTNQEITNTRQELQENFRRLGYSIERVAQDMAISTRQVEAVLAMANPDPSQVWMLRDYLEDKLTDQGLELYPFTRLADHTANRWFSYETPWRNA